MIEKSKSRSKLILRNLGINTYKEAVIYMREDCHVCKAEGFEVQARVQVSNLRNSVIATLNVIKSNLLQQGEVGLSEYAIEKLAARGGEELFICHPGTIASLSDMRSKIYGNSLNKSQFSVIIDDIVNGQYSDIHISSFLTACAGGRLNKQEILNLTEAMIESGDRLEWGKELVVDKHCVGGLPGNRTTPIVVAIVSAFGLTMPKTSSRAITSPAGTADTMEVLAPVDLDVSKLRRVVEKENGCIVWGGSVSLSPADDLLIRVEKALDLDSEGQLIASVLSKKIAAGSSHVLIDIPVGPTAKVRSTEMADELSRHLEYTGTALGLNVRAHTSDGRQPIGNGIGPALEARDLVKVLQNKKDAPKDLRERALDLAGLTLEFSSKVQNGAGREIAENILVTDKAWEKFQSICEAQGGQKEIPVAQYTRSIEASNLGNVSNIDNRRIAKAAKLAGAPNEPVAGIDLHVNLGSKVDIGQPIFTVHSSSVGELEYAISYIKSQEDIISIKGGS